MKTQNSKVPNNLRPYYETPGFSFAKLGSFLGYPSCCVEAFEVLLQRGVYYSRTASIKDTQPGIIGTGFRPCIRCAEKYTADEMIAVIAAARECPSPFPYLQWDYDTLTALAEYCAEETV